MKPVKVSQDCLPSNDELDRDIVTGKISNVINYPSAEGLLSKVKTSVGEYA